MLPVPLSHVKGGVCAADHGLGDAVAHVTVVFKLDTDPDELMAMADDQVRPVAEVISKRAERAMRWAFEQQPIDFPASRRFSSGWNSDEEGEFEECAPPRCNDVMAAVGLCSFCVDHPGGEAVEVDEFNLMQQTLTGAEIQQAMENSLTRRRLAPAQSPVGAATRAISSPDTAPGGWVSRRGPNGRLYWHHLSLGPAPWELEPQHAATERCGVPQRGDPFAGRNVPPLPGGVLMGTGFGPIVSPNLPADAWVSQIGPGGRQFWHNRSLGPAPWEVPRESFQRPTSTI